MVLRHPAAVYGGRGFSALGSKTDSGLLSALYHKFEYREVKVLSIMLDMDSSRDIIMISK